MSKNVKILALEGSVNKDSLSQKFLSKILENVKNIESKVVNLNQEIFANSSLNQNNLSNFFELNNSDKWINLLKETNYLIISFPMINFTYPATVKNFMDTICVANKTFSYKYSKKGDAIGLLNNLKVILISTQGAPEGWYPWGNPLAQLEGVWKFLGAKEVKTLLIDGTKIAPNNTLSHEEILKRYETKVLEITKNIKIEE